MGKWTKWTPELVADKLIGLHLRWQQENGEKAGKPPFNPAYLKSIGERQVYDQNKSKRGVFARALALVPDEVRDDWQARPHTRWTEQKVAGRLQELFGKWWKEEHVRRTGIRWSLSYITNVDKTFVRVVQRLGFKIEAFITRRLSGDIRTYWRPTRRLNRRARTARRTFTTAAKELTALHRRWRSDAERGKPAGKPFGPQYLRNVGEERLEAWIRRNKAQAMVLAYAPLAVGKDWTGKGSVKIVARMRLG